MCWFVKKHNEEKIKIAIKQYFYDSYTEDIININPITTLKIPDMVISHIDVKNKKCEIYIDIHFKKSGILTKK